jgi:hypothetical protein
MEKLWLWTKAARPFSQCKHSQWASNSFICIGFRLAQRKKPSKVGDRRTKSEAGITATEPVSVSILMGYSQLSLQLLTADFQ